MPILHPTLAHTHTHTVYTLGIIDLCLRYYKWYRWSSNTCGIIFAIVMGPINVNSDHSCYKFGVMTHAMNTSSCELYIYATPLNIKQHGLANEAKTLTEATFIYCTLYSKENNSWYLLYGWLVCTMLVVHIPPAAHLCIPGCIPCRTIKLKCRLKSDPHNAWCMWSCCHTIAVVEALVE